MDDRHTAIHKERHQKNLETALAGLGEDHPATALCYSQLGKTFLNIGEYKEAEHHLKKALELRKKLMGELDKFTLESSHYYGLALRNLGQHRKAGKHIEDAVIGRKKVLGKFNTDTCKSLRVFGNLLEYLGMYKSAASCKKEVVEICKEIYGADDQRTIIALNNLGFTYVSMEAFDEAGSTYNEALDICRRNYGENHEEYGVISFHLGVMNRQMGELEDAKAFHEKALETIPEDHSFFTDVILSLANCIEDTGDLAASKPIYERALAATIDSHGKMHPKTAKRYQDLTSVTYSMGLIYEAWQHAESEVEVLKGIYPENHPLTAEAMKEAAHLKTKI